VLHLLQHHSANNAHAAVETLPVRGKVRPEPVESLFAEASLFFGVELGGVLSLTGSGQRGGAGGAVTEGPFQLVSQSWLCGEGVGRETRDSGVHPLGVAQGRDVQAFLNGGGLLHPREQAGQAHFELRELLTLLQLPGNVHPQGVFVGN
jgi:hypothetical protein